MKILSVVGTRPNFMKIAPLVEEFKKHKVEHVLVHTGQHYDTKMSKLFFDDLRLPKPDIDLGIGSGNYAEQVGNILIQLEAVLKSLFDELQSKSSVDKLSKILSQRYEKRKGGYSRVIRAGYRYGDDAPMAVIELVDRDPLAKKVDLKKKTEESPKTKIESGPKDTEKKVKSKK